MGRAAGAGADIVVAIDHHSRFEDPAVIRRALLDGAESPPGPHRAFEIPEPRLAIRADLGMAVVTTPSCGWGPGSRTTGSSADPTSPTHRERIPAPPSPKRDGGASQARMIGDNGRCIEDFPATQ
jgi:hypothetical protein